MTFAELGSALRQEREKRHLSIDDVARQLKINPRLLHALEAADGQALPHPAYARGFIRSYAGFLGFSQEEIQQWLSDLQPEDLKKPKPAETGQPASKTQASQEAPLPEYEAPARRRQRGAGKAVGACLILCALAGGGYWLWQSGRLPFLEMKKEEPAEIINKLPGADTYAPQPAAAPPRVEEPPQTVLAPIQKPETLEQAIGSRASAPEAPASQPAPAAPDAGAGAEPAAQETAEPIEPHKLIITAIEECWVHSTADKTDTRQFSLRKGDTFALTFADLLELKLGNAGGVRLRYDGNELPPPGTSGQVRTITFPPKTD